MIIKLLPAQITELWDSIRFGVINAIAPLIDPTPDNIQDILCQLIKQDMQCWCVYGEDKKIYGYIITSISIDVNVNFRTLLIYSVFLYEQAPMDMWEEGMRIVEEFAKTNSCSRIVAYTANPNILSIASKNGYNSDYTYIVKELGG